MLASKVIWLQCDAKSGIDGHVGSDLDLQSIICTIKEFVEVKSQGQLPLVFQFSQL